MPILIFFQFANFGNQSLDNPVKLDGFEFDKKPCTTATVPVVQGQKLSRAPFLSLRCMIVPH